MKNKILFFFFLFTLLQLEAQIQTKIGMGPSFNFTKSGALLFQSYEPTISYFGEVGAVHQTKLVNLHMTMQWKQLNYKLVHSHPGISSTGPFEFRNDNAVLNPFVEFKLIKQLGISIGGYGSFSFNEKFKVDGKWQQGLFGMVTEEIDYGLTAGVWIYITKFVSAGIQFHRGFANINDLQMTDPNGNFLENVWLRNEGLQVKANYYFGEW